MRVGSTWLCDLISGLFKRKSWVFWERGKYIPKKRFEKQIKSNKGINIFKMHYTHPKLICDLITPGDQNNFVISITRDLKDIAVSKILYIKYDKPMRSLNRLKSINDMRIDFGRKDLSDRRYINLFIGSPHFKHIVENWKMYNDGFSHPNYLLLTYEELHARRLYVMKKVTNFLNIYRNNKGLRQIIIENNFNSKSGRKNGDGVNSSFRRKGIVGDFKNFINKRNIEYIDKLVYDYEHRETEE